jgi:hypothetical protein
MILFTTRFIGDTDGDMDGHGDLGTHGTALYGDGHHLTTGIIGDAVRFGEEVSMDITTLHLTNTIDVELLQIDMVLAKEFVQALIEIGVLS